MKGARSPGSKPPPVNTITRSLAGQTLMRALDSKIENYANVARITLDAMTAYVEDVRAARQIKGTPPAK